MFPFKPTSSLLCLTVRRPSASGSSAASAARPSIHVLVLGDCPLECMLAEVVRSFNAERSHQGLAQPIPIGAALLANIHGRVVMAPVLGGLHHAYRRAA
jgi:hypothetical protein